MRVFLMCSFIIIFTSFDSTSSCGDENMTGFDLEKLRVFDRMSKLEREAFLSDLEKERHAILEGLLVGLGSEHEQIRFCSAYLLGHYRFNQAAGSLADVVTMENPELTRNTREQRWGRYPAVEALIRLGKPSVPPMISNLETSDDEHVRGLSARVIYHVEGPELARIVVEMAITKQPDPVKKKRLETALSLLKGGEYKKPG